MPTNPLTPDELVATLCRSSLPTILVEGSTDSSVILRQIERQLGPTGANILACGGRCTLLEVFERRNEYQGRPVVFLADRDMWVFSGVPSEYGEIVWTRGYCIENDLYSPNLEALLDETETAEFCALVKEVSRWFAHCYEAHLAGRSVFVSTHVNRLVPLGCSALDVEYMCSVGYFEPSIENVQMVFESRYTHLRGKQLWQMLMRFLSRSDRSAKYSFDALVDLSMRVFQPSSLTDLLARLRDALDSCIGEERSGVGGSSLA